MRDWVYTRKAYVNWLSKTKLRREFSDNVKFDDLSLWWITNLMDKDNWNDPKWYVNLNKKLNSKEENLKININYFVLSMKLIKRFISKLISCFVIKLILSDSFKISKKKYKRDCFYTLFYNFTKFKGKFIDRQYGLASFKKRGEKAYLIELPENLFFLNKILDTKKKLKNVPVDYVILNSIIKFSDIIKVYFNSISLLFITFKVLNKSNYFLIKNVDCREILENKLISTFFGPIQEQILKGIALKRSLNLIKPKNIINCFCFFPQARVLYFYARKSNVKNIINTNHALYSEQNIFWNFNKIDFSSKKTSYYSPQPDIFLCKGMQDYQKLKKTFKNEKILLIGCLKTEVRPFNLKRKTHKKSKKFHKKIIITILSGIRDSESIVKILNQCDLDKYTIYVSPHPLVRKQTYKFFNDNFKSNYIEDTSIKKTRLLQISEYIIFGESQMGTELALKNYNVIRVYENEFIPHYNTNDEIPTACDKYKLRELLTKRRINKKIGQLEKNYFYKYDNKASTRLQKILDKL